MLEDSHQILSLRESLEEESKHSGELMPLSQWQAFKEQVHVQHGTNVATLDAIEEDEMSEITEFKDAAAS